MFIYNLIEHRDHNPKKLGSLWQYHKDEPVLDTHGVDHSKLVWKFYYNR